jgi:hypothetical protein
MKTVLVTLAFVSSLLIGLDALSAAPVRNFSPIIKNNVTKAGTCTTRCYPSYGGGQTCHTSCF